MTGVRLATILLLGSLAGGQEFSTPEIGRSNTATPKLPVADNNACPGPSRRTDGVLEPVQIKLRRNARIYSSWKPDRVPVARAKVGEEVSALSGVNVIREPDKIRVLQPSGGSDVPSLQSGDEVLGYGLRGDGNYVFWAKGVWYTLGYEFEGDLTGGCGFANKSECTFAISNRGVREWWVNVKTKAGVTGWVLASKTVHEKAWSDPNFRDLCILD